MFQYVLFDLDGTLTDPKEGITKCVQFALERQGIHEPDLDKLEPFIGPPLKDSFMEFYGMTEEQALIGSADYRKRFAPIGIFENKVYPGIPEMLAHLKEAGVRLAVASSKPETFVLQILEHFELASYFDVVVGSNLDGTRSEKEEVVEEALRRLKETAGTQRKTETAEQQGKAETAEQQGKAETAERQKEAAGGNGQGGAFDRNCCAMVGDRKFDIYGAKKYGLTAVGVSYGYAGKGELKEAGADYIAGAVGQLEAFLLRGSETGRGSGRRLSAALSGFHKNKFWKTWDILFPFLLYYLSYHACYIVVMTLIQLFCRTDPAVYEWMEKNGYLAAGIAQGFCMLAGAGALLPLFRREQTAWKSRTPVSCLTAGIMAGAMAVGFNLLFRLLYLTQISARYTETAKAQYRVPVVCGLILYGVVSPLSEEILFRGLIYNRMKRYFPVKWAILLSALFFGLYHGNLVQALYGMILGAMIAYVYEASGEFKIPVLAHAAANCAVFLLTYRESAMEAVTTPINCVIFLLISLASLWRLQKRAKD